MRWKVKLRTVHIQEAFVVADTAEEAQQNAESGIATVFGRERYLYTLPAECGTVEEVTLDDVSGEGVFPGY